MKDSEKVQIPGIRTGKERKSFGLSDPPHAPFQTSDLFSHSARRPQRLVHGVLATTLAWAGAFGVLPFETAMGSAMIALALGEAPGLLHRIKASDTFRYSHSPFSKDDYLTTLPTKLGIKPEQLVFPRSYPLRIAEGFQQATQNVLYLPLPDLVQTRRFRESMGPVGKNQQLRRAYATLWDLALAQAGDFARNGDTNHLCITFPTNLPPEIQTMLQDKAPISGTISLGLLYDTKGIVPKDPDRPAWLVNERGIRHPSSGFREKELYTTPFDLTPFRSYYFKLGDPKLNSLVGIETQYRLSYKEKAILEGHIRKRLLEIIRQELGASFDSEVVREASQNPAYPLRGIKKRTSTLSYVERTRDGQLCLRVFNNQGFVSTTPLSTIFNFHGISPEEVIGERGYLISRIADGEFTEVEIDPGSPVTPKALPGTKLRQAEVAYALDLLLNTKPNPELRRPELPEEDEFLATLETLGLKINPQRETLASMISMRRSLINQYLRRPKRALSLVLLAGYFALSNASPDFFQQHFFQSPAKLEQVNVAQKEVTMSESVGIGKLPEHNLDWAIGGYNGANVSGYYTTHTAADIVKGQWQFNQELLGEVQFPQDIDPKSTHVGMYSYTSAQQIKLPIKNQTRIGSVKVQDEKGVPIAFKTLLYSDGTVEVVIPQKPAGAYWMRIEASLVPDQAGQVQGKGEIKPIDLSKLTPRARQYVEETVAIAKVSPLFYDLVATQIRESYRYTIDPKNTKAVKELKEANSLEAIINALVQFDGLNCGQANTLAGAIVSLDGAEGGPVKAMGFLVQAGLPSSSKAGLYREALHAYLIYQGKVIDATPTELMSNPLTLEFLQMLHPSTEGQPEIPKTDGTKINDQLPESRFSPQNALLAGVAAVTLAGMAGLWWKSRREDHLTLEERVFNKEGRNEDPSVEPSLHYQPGVLANHFDEQGLAESGSFLKWVCFGGDRNYSPSTITEDEESLIRNMPISGLKRYLADPTVYEQKAAIDQNQAILYRSVAQKIIASLE